MADDVLIAGKLFAADEVNVEGAQKLVIREKMGWGAPGTYNDVDATAAAGQGPLPVTDAALATALQSILTELLQKLETGQAVDLSSASLAALETIQVGNQPADPATQTTLAAVLAQLATIDGHVDGLEGFTDGIEGKLDTLHTDAGTLATQTTLAAVLAKLSADPATQTTLAACATSLATIATALAHGTYAYAAGTAAGTVDVPSGGRVKRVSVVAGAGGSATVTIAGGASITIAAGGSFDEQIPGDAALGADVVIGGNVASYYVAWLV